MKKLLGIGGEHCLLGESALGRLGDAKVDHLDVRLVVAQGHHDVGGLEVAVDHALLVGVLHRLAHFAEELESCARGELRLIAVLRDGDALDEI